MVSRIEAMNNLMAKTEKVMVKFPNADVTLAFY